MIFRGSAPKALQYVICQIFEMKPQGTYRWGSSLSPQLGISPQPGLPLQKRARATVRKDSRHVSVMALMALMAMRMRVKREVVGRASSVAPRVEELAGCLSKGRATNTGSDWQEGTARQQLRPQHARASPQDGSTRRTYTVSVPSRQDASELLAVSPRAEGPGDQPWQGNARANLIAANRPVLRWLTDLALLAPDRHVRRASCHGHNNGACHTCTPYCAPSYLATKDAATPFVSWQMAPKV
ncbi:hypothetical protein VTN00DRAFT_6724 [Thermoascus crustaceus]|uniref:uncharacterized protein n=1 Tax=Thermoascus crustaceus TaxID=5088 RepID=UPI003741F6A4